MDEAVATRNLINWLHADPKADEDQARRLLAKLLRTTRPLDLGLRFALGDLFDPDLGQEQGCYLTIKRVRGNPRIKRVNLWSVAAYVWRATREGTLPKNAVTRARERGIDYRERERTAMELGPNWVRSIPGRSERERNARPEFSLSSNVLIKFSEKWTPFSGANEQRTDCD